MPGYMYIAPDYESGSPGGYYDTDTGQITAQPPAGMRQAIVTNDGRSTYADGSTVYARRDSPGDMTNLRQNYHPFIENPNLTDDQIWQYVQQHAGPLFELGSNAPGLTSKTDNSQFMGGLGPMLPLLAMTIATGGAGLGLGGLLEGGTIAGDAFLPGALGADGLGAGAATFGGAGGSLANTFGGGSSLFDFNGGLSTLGTSNTLPGIAADAPWNLNPYTIPSGGGMDLSGFLNSDPFGFGGGSVFDYSGGLNGFETTNALNPMTDWWNGPMPTSAGGVPFPGQTFDLGNSLNPGTVDLQNILPNLPSGIQDIIKKLMSSGTGAAGGGQQQGGIAGLLQSLGLGSGLSGALGSAINSAPVLATLNYARNQNPIDTSGLQTLAQNYNPQAQAGMYDVQTGQGRNALDSSLTNRGVAGSSFGNFDQASYDTLRGIGRSQLVNQGAATQAGIYGQINSANLQSQQLKNQLLGSGLNALGLMANPNRGITLNGP